jgi:hypothetical protein
MIIRIRIGWWIDGSHDFSIQEIEQEDLIVYRDEIPLNTYFKRTLKEPDFVPEKVRKYSI